MVFDSRGHDQNDVDAYSSTAEETLTPPPSLSSTQPLPALPFDLIAEILCRLPLKFLLQYRCICKSWNSLISDSNFAKKHLRLSTSFSLHSLRYSNPLGKYILMSFPLDSVFSTMPSKVTELEFPENSFDGKYPSRYPPRFIVGSCNGIIYLAHIRGSCFVSVWNPSIRKFKELPSFLIPEGVSHIRMTHAFGYDHVNDNYKAVVLLKYCVGVLTKTEVKVHIFGSNIWKSIQGFPFGGVPCDLSGKFVSGTINWLASKHQESKRSYFIVSFDLRKESYQKILLPDCGQADVNLSELSVLRDCLCMIFGHEVWVMKEYGNKESWTKLFTVSSMLCPGKSYNLIKAIYMFEDEQLLLEYIEHGNPYKKLTVYDPRNGTFKYPNFQNKSVHALEVCVESLISPWSYC